MVKFRRFRKSLRSSGYSRNRGGFSRFSYKKPFRSYKKSYRSYKKPYRSRYGSNRSFSSFSRFGNKRNFSSSKRFFRPGASTLSGQVPSYTFKTIASSLLTALNAHVSDFFVNSPTFVSKDFDDLPQYFSSRSHTDSLRVLNPQNVFKLSPDYYGIDSHTTDPIIRVLKHKLDFSGHNQDLVDILSFYSPMSLSYSSSLELNRLLGLRMEYLPSVLQLIGNFPTLVYSSSGGDQTVTEYHVGAFHFMLSPEAYVNNNNAPYSQANVFGAASVASILGNRDALRDIFHHIFNRLCLNSSPTYSYNEVLALDITPGRLTYSFIPVGFVDADYVDLNAFKARMLLVLQAAVPNQDVYSSVHDNNPLFRTIFLLNNVAEVNNFRKSLYCLTSLSQTDTSNFVSFIADMFTHAYVKAKNNNFEAKSTLVAQYISDFSHRQDDAMLDFSSIEKLVNAGIMRVKRISTSRAVSYLPKSQNNAHWVIASPGVTVKLSTSFMRDYSGFMALFRNVARHKFLRNELNSGGIDLYRRLEPSYNLLVK